MLFVIFFCAVSTQNIYALCKNSTNVYKGFSVKKRIKFIQTPDTERTYPGDNIFENETEDKTGTGFNASLPVFNAITTFTGLILPLNSVTFSSNDKGLQDIQQPLYLVIRSFRT
ncbi:MAG TPA: hypothetical protein VNY73_04910 [Bacteroidia bacterium]|nr:hypothetical protein [Bacteroidia bacterium]